MSRSSMRRAVRYGLPTVVAAAAVLTGTVPAAAAPTTKVTGLEKACTVIGTHGNDRIFGTHGYDVICGLGGDDQTATQEVLRCRTLRSAAKV